MLARSSGSLRFGVQNFQIQDEDRELFDFLMTGRKKATKLGKYIFKNCGTGKEIFNIKNLVFGPDPISFPGDLTVSFDGTINSDVDAPLKATVLLEKKFGSSYIKIPCIGNIGSCTYDDLCQLLAGATCPPPFVTNKVPCKCPFRKGSYSLPSATFEVDAAVFPSGDYHASANVTLNGNLVTCIDIMASFD